MEAHDIKETWKAGVEKNIKPYPEEKLNEMVIKSARKSIKTVYPGTVFRLVVVAVVVYLIVMLFIREQSMERAYVDIAALAVLSVSYFLWERSAYRMRKYTNGMAVKEWLEYRIKEVEKDVKFNTKYGWIVYVFLSLGNRLLCVLSDGNEYNSRHTERRSCPTRHSHLPADHRPFFRTELPENPP